MRPLMPLVATLSLLGCRPATESQPREGLNARNALARFGLTPRNWNQIRNVTSGEVTQNLHYSVPGHPGGDIAKRTWRLFSTPEMTTFTEPLSIWEQYSSGRGLDPTDVLSPWLAALSPAEKMDIARNRGQVQLPQDRLDNMRRVHDTWENSPTLQGLRQSVRDLETGISQESMFFYSNRSLFILEGSETSTAIEQLRDLMPHLPTQNLQPPPVDASQKFWGAVFTPAWQQKRAAYAHDLALWEQGSLSLATLLENHKNFLDAAQSLLAKIENIIVVTEPAHPLPVAIGTSLAKDEAPEEEDLPTRLQRIVAENSDKLVSLTASSHPFLPHSSTREELWQQLRDMEVQFYKAMAKPGAEREALARTLSPFLPATAEGWRNWGRTYRVGDWDFSGTCHGETLAALKHPEIKSLNHVRLEGPGFNLLFSSNEIGALFAKAWGTQKIGNNLYAGQRCNIREGTPGSANDQGRPTATECRDVNPATLHLALVELIHEQATPFAMDGAQFHEVWNSVVRSFEFAFPPTTLRDGTVSEGGTPVVREAWEDPAAVHRNPETRFLLPVQAKLNGYMSLNYTLELDADFNLIGGEWTPDTSLPPDNSMSVSSHPDFLWRPGPDVRLADGPISLPILQRLMECAQQTPSESVVLRTPAGNPSENPVEAVPCPLAP